MSIIIISPGTRCHLLGWEFTFNAIQACGAYPIYFPKMLEDNRWLTAVYFGHSVRSISNLYKWHPFTKMLSGLAHAAADWDCCFTVLLPDAACFPFSWDARLLIVAFPSNWWTFRFFFFWNFTNPPPYGNRSNQTNILAMSTNNNEGEQANKQNHCKHCIIQAGDSSLLLRPYGGPTLLQL